MTSAEIRERYLKFFEKRGHTIIPSASLVPENDPSSLFTTAGMQPLVPYLMGQKHPAGNRLVNVQKCVRTGDIDDVGDNRHLTFFEMLGNWSLGDPASTLGGYFKKESINWSFEFLTSKKEGLGLDGTRIYVTTFKGEDGIPADTESVKVWQEVLSKNELSHGVADDSEMINSDIRIIPLGAEDNFWIAGQTGPCGGDTEIFYDVVGGNMAGRFSDLVKDGRLVEIWNNVFMEFNKTVDGRYEPLAQKNVDTGMGLERTAVVMQNKDNVFDTDVFASILTVTKKITADIRAQRIIADHFRAAIFIITDGVRPSNTEAGYVLRRLLRRAVIKAANKNIKVAETRLLVQAVVENFDHFYPEIDRVDDITRIIQEEIDRFQTTLEQGLKEFEKGTEAFDLFQTFGFPIEMTVELARERGKEIDLADFQLKMKRHQELSKAGSGQKFKGGLAGTGEKETQYHTATHLLHQALRDVLGNNVQQKGSNITSERLRFDFVYSTKMTDDEKRKVEDIVNAKIKEKLPVNKIILSKAEAEKTGALHFFGDKYGDEVSVYYIGDSIDHAYSKEFCGGPHVTNIGTLGQFKIIKEEAVSAGVRRIKATLI